MTDGYLVVIIPPSADAPHRADYRYWGRSAGGKVELRNEEVERITARISSAIWPAKSSRVSPLMWAPGW